MSRKRFWKPFSPDQRPSSDDRQAVWLRGRTVDRFARQVVSLDELDPPVQAAFQQTLRPGETISLIIYAPFQAYLRGRSSTRWFRRLLLQSRRPLMGSQRPLPWEYSPDWVIELAEGRLLLVQRTLDGQPGQILSIPFEKILTLQNGVVLLFSWFEVQWVQDGTIRQQVIYFNAVCAALFARLCAMIRCKLAGETWAPVRLPDCNLGVLDPLPYKFRNMIPLHALLEGEQVIEILFRPALWKKRMVAFRTMMAPRLAAVLTNLHLLLVEEDLTGSEGSYGFICTYLPLSRVYQVAVEGQQLTISLTLDHLIKDYCIDFPLARQAEAVQLASALKGVLPEELAYP